MYQQQGELSPATGDHSSHYKTIPVTMLTVDMYVSEMMAAEGKPLPKKKRGMIRDPRIIEKFIEIGIEQVTIDLSRGRDIETLKEAEAQQAEKLHHNDEINESLERLRQHTASQRQDLKLEWKTAREIFRSSVNIVHSTIQAVREGIHINPVYFCDAAKAISRSIMRNPDALTWLGKLRDQDNYLYEHSVNTAVLMGVFAQSQGMSLDQIELCIHGALMHDLGQGAHAQSLISREGPLNEEEFAEIRQHTDRGMELARKSGKQEEIVQQIITQHHERIDGSGYPRGLKGREIALVARMFSIVDTYDALTNNRYYKQAVPSSVAMRTLLELGGTQFDTNLVHQFIKCMGVYPTGSLVKLNNGILAVVIAQTPGFPLKPLVRTVFNSRNDCYLEPRMLNLSNHNDGEKIISYENPEQYGIDVNEFLPEEMEL